MHQFKLVISLIVLTFQFNNPLLAQWTETGATGGYANAFWVIDSTLYAGETGVYKTRLDSAANWSNCVHSGPNFPMFVKDFTSLDNRLFAATSDGIYSSVDEGENWTHHYDPSFNSAYYIAQSNGVFYGNDDFELYVSFDTCNTWNYIRDYVKGDFAVGPGCVFLATSSSSKDISVTYDDGQNWLLFDTNIISYGFIRSMCIADSELVIGTDLGILKSNILTPSFSQYNSGLGADTLITNVVFSEGMLYCLSSQYKIYSAPITTMQWTQISFPQIETGNIFAFNGEVYYTQYNGVYKTDGDTINWLDYSRGFNHCAVNAVDDNGSLTFMATTVGLYACRDTTNIFVPADFGITDTFYFTTVVVDSNIIYTSAGGAGVYQSNDTGATWFLINNGLNSGSLFIKRLVVSADSIYAFNYYLSNTEVYVTSKNNINWRLILDYSTHQLNEINSMFFSNDTLYITDGFTTLFYTNGNWTDFTGSLTNTFYSLIKCENDLFVIRNSNELWKASLSDFQWQQVPTNGLPVTQAFSIIEVGKNLMISFMGEIYLSTDKGINWSMYFDNHNLPCYSFPYLYRNPNSPYVFCSTGYNGLFKTDVSNLLIGTPEIVSTPKGIHIYPNPATNELNFTLNESDIKINEVKVYDVNGKLVSINNSGSSKLRISLRPGIYLVETSTQKQVYKNVVIVQEE